MSATFGGAALSAREALRRDPALLERFSDRARALFYARLAFLAIGLAVLAVPSWSLFLGTTSSTAFVFYFAVIAYSVLNYLFIEHPRFGRRLTFVTLCLDLVALCSMVLLSGGLSSPIMAAHGLFTLFFILLFPRKRSIVPPLLILPIAGQLHDSLTSGVVRSETIFLIGWYATLSVIVAYVLLFLHRRDEKRRVQLSQLSKAQETSIVTQERLRLAREIHDGLGGSLSSLIIQAEFIQRMTKEESLRIEITELKSQAEEAIEELRRSLTMMRRDFDLHKALEDYCMRFQERARVWCSLKVRGRTRRLPSEMQLAIFRILQECLTNIQKHAKAKNADVRLKYDGDLITLTVTDDGVGFDPSEQRSGHYGLSNLKARATKFRGTVDVQSTPGAGATAHITLVVPTEGSHVAFLPSMGD
ncbi:MAG: sensor histidine kinase [Deltaproteobacteria bacterium]|nr:sensor histidine kinase [Deltaproteobacteria bacterium]